MVPLATELVLRVLERCERNGERLIVVEDGGYISPLFLGHEAVAAHSLLCDGMVEQTTNGIYLFDEALAISGKSANVTLVIVAESDLKKRIEAPLIGEVAVQSIENLMLRRELSLRGRKVLLLGCGTIGRKLLDFLLQKECQVTVAEQDETKTEGLPPGASAIAARDLEQNIGTHSIVIGTTGRYPFVDYRHFLALKDKAILVNASSKKREFHEEVLAHATKLPDRKIFGFGTEYTLVNGKTFFLLADGYPVNFYEGESVAGELLQPIMGLLLAGALFLEKRNSPKGKIDVPDDVQWAMERYYQDAMADR